MRADKAIGKEVRVTTASGIFLGFLCGVHFREGDDGMMDGVEYVDVLQRVPDGSSIEHNYLAPDQVAFVDHDDFDDDAR
jgi:hypothetical protein